MIPSMFRAAIAKAALPVVVLTPLALADVPPPPAPRIAPPIVNFFDAGKAHCWIRTYDDKHMTAHSKQKVTAIAFAYQPETLVEGRKEPNWDQYGDGKSFSGVLVVTLKDDKRPAFASASCRAGSDKSRLDCGVEGDGGQFVMSDPGEDKLRIDIPTGISVEFSGGEDGQSEYARIESKDDQDAFLLTAGQGGLCATAYAMP